MSWDDLRHFLALAGTGSLSAAARRLGVDHTTVARRVDALEAALGVRLLDRLARGWHLTPEGERLAEDAARVEDEILRLERRARGVAGVAGTVRISAPPVLASRFLAPRLGPLRAAHPSIEIELIGEPRAASLGRREADIAIRLSRPTDGALVTRRLALLAYGLYAGAAYAARTPPAAYVFLGYDDSLGDVPQQRWLLRAAAGRPCVLRANDLATIHEATRAGLGVAALPRFLADDDPALIEIETSEPAVSREIWLIVHPDLRRSPRVRAVMDALVAMVERHRAVLEGDPASVARPMKQPIAPQKPV
jgi:DNA-binding transcriptional LysR family regulator